MNGASREPRPIEYGTRWCGGEIPKTIHITSRITARSLAFITFYARFRLLPNRGQKCVRSMFRTFSLRGCCFYWPLILGLSRPPRVSLARGNSYSGDFTFVLFCLSHDSYYLPDICCIFIILHFVLFILRLHDTLYIFLFITLLCTYICTSCFPFSLVLPSFFSLINASLCIPLDPDRG